MAGFQTRLRTKVCTRLRTRPQTDLRNCNQQQRLLHLHRHGLALAPLTCHFGSALTVTTILVRGYDRHFGLDLDWVSLTPASDVNTGITRFYGGRRHIATILSEKLDTAFREIWDGVGHATRP